MSLLIKGLNMPKNCLLCPCCVGEGIGMGRQHYCQGIDDEPCVSETYRPKNCPLIEVPTPHGRLIDEEAIYNNVKSRCNNCHIRACAICGVTRILNDIRTAPTIIEAEVSE